MIGSLTLDQLRVLVTIADTGSFSAAGRKLGRVQSAISQAIATLETVQGVMLFDRTEHRPMLTEQGRVLVNEARHVLASADRFESIASGMQAGLEAELTLVIDPFVPSEPLVERLRELQHEFPDLPVRIQTEVLGGAARSMRAGVAAMAICLLLPAVPMDLVAYPLSTLRLIPVAAAHHPLASIKRTLNRHDLAPYVQLVLSDPAAEDTDDYGVFSERPWRFVEQGRRLDFLLGGFGWCKMPEHLVASHVDNGRLVILDVADDVLRSSPDLTIYAAYAANAPLGRAGGWLLERMRQRWPSQETASRGT